MFIFAILILIPAVAFAQDAHDELEGKLFGKLDTNKDDKVTRLENEVYLLSFDTDKDTEISRSEFTVAIDQLDAGFVGYENELFDLFDRKGDGHVDKADVDQVFTLGDFNGDDVISKSEFHVIFQAVVSHVG